jgi:hypothetical protein
VKYLFIISMLSCSVFLGTSSATSASTQEVTVSNSDKPNADSHSNVAGPSYEATVKWIQAKFADAGIPGHTLRVNPVPGAGPTPEIAAKVDRQPFTIAIDSCNATITTVESGDVDGEASSDTHVYKFPLSQIQSTSATMSGWYKAPATLIVTTDATLSWSRYMTDSDGTQTTGGIVKDNRVEIPFGAPGMQDAPQHMAAAFQHLSEICKVNPNQQGAKDLF